MNVNDIVSYVIKFGFSIGSLMYVSFWIIGFAINSGLSLFEYITKK